MSLKKGKNGHMGMKKLLALVMIIAVVMSSLVQINVFGAKTFPDVPAKHPNYDAIMTLTGMGVIAGYDDGTFQPQREITRTEFCALMARTLGCNKETYKPGNIPFSDVKKDYWGISFISYCYELGLINGMGDGTFAPADKVTMAQAIKMAVCAVGKEKEATRYTGKYWYSGYIKVAEKYGLLDNTDQEPDENAVRANVAQIVYNMVQSGLVDTENSDNTETSDKNDKTDKNDSKEEESNKTESNKQDEADKSETVEKPKEKTAEDYLKEEENARVSPLGSLPRAKMPSTDLKPNNISGVTFDEDEAQEITEEFKNKDYSQLKVIVIDAGHNYSGGDTGARIGALDVREEIVTWVIADKLRTRLEKMGYTVYMTRDNVNDNIANSSVGASLKARVDFAHKKKADLFISIHCNMGGGTGIETYCFSRGGYSERLAKLIQDKIVPATGSRNRGVKTADFYVVKYTAMPSVLVETGFLDDGYDRRTLLSEKGQDAIAVAIAEAVKKYDSMEPIVVEKQPEPAEESETDESE